MFLESLSHLFRELKFKPTCVPVSRIKKFHFLPDIGVYELLPRDSFRKDFLNNKNVWHRKFYPHDLSIETLFLLES